MTKHHNHTLPGVTLPNAHKLGLNPLAFCSFPTRGESLGDEVHDVLNRFSAGVYSREEAKQAVLNIIGREKDALEKGLMEAYAGRVEYVEDGE